LHKIKNKYKNVNKNVKVFRSNQTKTKYLFWIRVVIHQTGKKPKFLKSLIIRIPGKNSLLLFTGYQDAIGITKIVA
jgi:hypothetical protein